MEEKNIELARTGTVHYYPYHTLPLLESHLHPKFAIFNAGSKLKKLETPESFSKLETLFDKYPGLEKTLRLYDAWIRPLPASALKDESYFDPNDILVEDSNGSEHSDDEDIDYTCQTKSGRGDGFKYFPKTRSVAAADRAKRPRTRSIAAAEEDGDFETNQAKSTRRRKTSAKQKAPAVVKKWKVLSESSTFNQQLLSEASISRINQQYGESVWTDDRIRRWSNTFPKKRKHL